jgi:glucokinase
VDQDEYVAGVDLGATKILSVVLDAQHRVVGEDTRLTQAASGGPEAVIERMVASVKTAAAGRKLRGAGISAAGPADLVRGIVTTPPNLPGWHDVPLARLVSEALGLPAVLENDANAAAVAEHRLGAGRGARHIVLITVGTGIGGGLILDGRLYRGASGGAGEIGHMQLEPEGRVCGCGRRGCLEALASGRALAADAAAIVAAEPDGLVARIAKDERVSPDARVLALAAQRGDASAADAIDRAGRYLGAGLANLIDVFNPELIVIGGSLRKLGERYLGPAREVAKRDAFAQHFADVRIVEAELGDEAPAIGAALLVDEVTSNQ